MVPFSLTQNKLATADETEGAKIIIHQKCNTCIEPWIKNRTSDTVPPAARKSQAKKI